MPAVQGVHSVGHVGARDGARRRLGRAPPQSRQGSCCSRAGDAGPSVRFLARARNCPYCQPSSTHLSRRTCRARLKAGPKGPGLFGHCPQCRRRRSAVHPSRRHPSPAVPRTGHRTLSSKRRGTTPLSHGLNEFNISTSADKQRAGPKRSLPRIRTSGSPTAVRVARILDVGFASMASLAL